MVPGQSIILPFRTGGRLAPSGRSPGARLPLVVALALALGGCGEGTLKFSFISAQQVEGKTYLVVNTSEIDFVASSKDLADLIKEINRMGAGTQYYVPLGSR